MFSPRLTLTFRVAGIPPQCKTQFVPRLTRSMGSDNGKKYPKVQLPGNKYSISGKLPKKLDAQTTKDWIQGLRDKDKNHLLRLLQESPPAKSPYNVTLNDSTPVVDDTAEENTAVPKPTGKELYQMAVYQSFPFIGFGFLDNLVMILAGEYIDHQLGVTLGISTMAAAALGNTISDVFGVASGGYIEHYSSKIGVHAPALTLEQLELPVTKASGYLGRTLGIIVGCLLGMAPLLVQ